MDKGILVCLAGRIKVSLRFLAIKKEQSPCCVSSAMLAVQEQMWTRLKKIGVNQH